MRRYLSAMRASRWVLPNEAENEDIWGTKTLLDVRLSTGKDLLALLVKYAGVKPEGMLGEGVVEEGKAKIVEVLLREDEGKEKEAGRRRRGDVIEDNTKFIGATGVPEIGRAHV